jgi:type I restriction enzyme S subunit
MVASAENTALWPQVRLGDYAKVIAGQSPESKYYNSKGIGLPFYQGKKEFGENTIGEPEVWTTVVTKVAEPGDILMSVRAPVGPVNFTDKQICIGRGLAAIRVSKNLLPEYLFYFFTSIKDQISGREGAVFASISRADIEQFELPLPPLAEQERIVARLDAAFAAIAEATAAAEANLRNARALFDSYLDQVFSTRGEGWVERRLGDVARFIDYRGKTPEKTTHGIPLITAKNIKMGYLQQEPREYIAAANYASWMTRGIPVNGDVLFTTEAPLGNVALLDTDQRVAFAQRVIIFQPSNDELLGSFLMYHLMSNETQIHIKQYATGATVQGIKASLLREICLHIPDVYTQKNITVQCKVCYEINASMIHLYNRKLTALTELKQSLLAEVFGEG